MRRCIPILILLLAAACGSDDDKKDGGVDVVDGNGRPVADAGVDRQVLVGEQVVLNGSGSRDREFTPLAYSWSFAEVPDGSTVRFADGEGALVNPAFVPDIHGTYVIRLTVDDGALTSEPASVTIEAAALPPLVDAGSDQLAIVGGEVLLDGAASADPAGGPLRFAWTFVARPDGATAVLQDDAAAQARFVPDRAGTWRIALQAETEAGSSAIDEVEVETYARGAEGRVSPLAWTVVDAEYDRTNDRLVAVSASPNELHVVDPVTLDEATLALPMAPRAVSIAPDGATAAVGHDGRITIVKLAPLEQVQTFELEANADEVVLAGNGWVYVFPGLNEPDGAWAIELATGDIHEASGWSIDSGTVARLHPDGRKIYGAENGLSPADIERYSIADGPLVREADSPYHGDYDMCGDLWLAEEGDRIFTACGNVFHASDVAAEDMTYSGRLISQPIVSLDDSAAAGLVATLPVTGGRNQLPNVAVELFDRTVLEHSKSLPLPAFPGLGRSWASNGRFAFFDAAGGQLIVLVRAEAGAELDAADGIVRWSLSE